MGKINRIVCALLLILTSGVAIAQNNTNSPYTRYAYGQLVDQGFGRNLGMGGVGYALRDNSQINPLNPAAYSAMDSLTFLFEGGISLQNTNFKEGSTKLNAKNSSLQYLALQFRLKKWMAMSVGVLPISNIGYSIDEIHAKVGENEQQYGITRRGSGGLHKVYAGLAFVPFKNFSIGVNAGFIWGDLTRTTLIYFPGIPPTDGTSSMKNSSRATIVSLRGLNFDFGAQYRLKFRDSRSLTLGLVYSPKVKLSNDVKIEDKLNSYSVTKLKSKYDMVASYGFGVSYEVNRKLVISSDILYQPWSKVKIRDEEGTLVDLTRVSVGAEYIPNYYSRNFLANIKYRLGAHYANPYYKIEGQRASKEFGVTAGIGMPLPKTKSQLNISAQFVRVNGQTDRFLNESTFRVNVGLIFNERWFFKPKI